MDFGAVFKAVCPWLATAIGGPLGGLAVDAATSALGLSDKTATGLKNALAGLTPADMLALKKADQEFKEHMIELGFDSLEKLEQIDADDRKDARAREVAVKDKTPARLAYMIIGGFFAVAGAQLVALMGWPDVAAKIPPQGWVIIGNISGYLAAEAKAAAAYYFGTTQSSAEKTQLLAQAAAIAPAQ